MDQIKCELQASFGDDRVIASAAWTSSLDYQKKQLRTDEDVARVVQMLATAKHCYDEETEILTKYGWKYFKDLKLTDLVASVTKHSHKIIWSNPKEIINQEYNGFMYSVNSSMINFKVTPNHDLYLGIQKNKTWLLPEKYKPEEISISPKRIYCSATEHSENLNHLDFLKGCLYGFYLGDGYWYNKNEIAFRLKKKRKIEYIKNLLLKLNLSYSERYTINQVTEIKLLANDYIFLFGKEKSSEKLIKSNFFDESSSLKLGIIDGLKNSDGTIKRNAWSFSTTSKNLKETFQTLGASLGLIVKENKGKQKTENHAEQYRLMILSRSITPLFNDTRLGNSNKLIKENYNGKIYCCTVSTGLILVRRNGCQMISGNSTPFESVIFRFWMRIPIAIDRQLMTHRLQSASGMSGRYRTMPSDYLEPSDDINIITAKLPQDKFVQLANGTQIYGMDDIIGRYFEVCESANNAYSQIVAIAKDSEKKGTITNSEFKRIREFYRGMLPQHNMTERVTTMNLRSFANFIKLRNSEHAQPEIKYLARLMLQEVKNKAQCPIAIEFLEKNNWEL